jgi:hypothetical protein
MRPAASLARYAPGADTNRVLRAPLIDQRSMDAWKQRFVISCNARSVKHGGNACDAVGDPLRLRPRRRSKIQLLDAQGRCLQLHGVARFHP